MNRIVLPILFVVFLFGCGDVPQTKQLSNTQYFCLNGQATCAIKRQSALFTILTNTKTIQPENLFDVVLSVNDVDQIVNATGYFEGISMYMGKIPLIFSRDELSGNFRADGFVGSCSDPNMHWRIIIDVDYIDSTGERKSTQLVDNFYSRS